MKKMGGHKSGRVEVVDLTLSDNDEVNLAPPPPKKVTREVDSDESLARQLQDEEYSSVPLPVQTNRYAEALDEFLKDVVVNPSEFPGLQKTSKSAKGPQQTQYTVEISKSGRSKCGVCNEVIANRAVRCHVWYPKCLFANWQHLECTTFDSRITCGEDIDGYGLLDQDDQDKVCVQIAQGAKLDLDAPINPDELVRKEWDQPLEPPETLMMPLLPFQKEGLGWMNNQEKSNSRGGILADEMGMGKTIQTIALLLLNKPLVSGDPNEAQEREMRDESDTSHGFDPTTAKKLSRGNTLLVLPTVAIRQWQSELSLFCTQGSLSVKVYHGADREANVGDLCKYDIIATSYKIAEIEYRKATAGVKICCSVCGKKYYEEQFRQHRRYFCGANAQRTEKQAKAQRKKDKDTTSSSSKTSSKTKKVIDNDEDASFGNLSCSDDGDDDDSGGEENVAKKRGVPTLSIPGRKVIDLDCDSGLDMMEVVSSSRSIKPLSKPKSKSKSAVKQNNEVKSQSTSKSLSKSAKSKISYLDDTETEDDEEALMELATDDSRAIDKVKTARNGKGGSTNAKNSSTTVVKKVATTKAKGNGAANAKSKSKAKKKQANDGDDDDDDDDEEEETMSVSSGAIKSKLSTKKGTKKSAKAVKVSDENEEDDWYDEEVEEEILKAKAAKSSVKAPKSILHEISWFRVVLDEAHMIKDRSTSTAKSVFALVSLYKWCLTGTPLQNRVGELYSLVRYLRVDPHGYYLCKKKGCDCKRLHYEFSSDKCTGCQHNKFNHYCVFNKEIMNPIKNFGYINNGKRAMEKLKNEVLDRILLRRTKKMRADDIQLPPQIVRVRQDRLSKWEEDFYEAVYSGAKAEFDTFVKAGTVLNNYANIFEVLMRLRQTIDHPYLVIASKTQQNAQLRSIAEKNEKLNALRKQVKASDAVEDDYEDHKLDCGLCKETSEDARRASCGCVFCCGCITQYCESTDDSLCPTCRKSLTIDLTEIASPIGLTSAAAAAAAAAQIEIDAEGEDDGNASFFPPIAAASTTRRKKNSILNRIKLDEFQSSTKLEALVQELHLMEQKDLGAKAIVFSQFTSMLELVEYRISLSGFTCGVLKGDMGIDARDGLIQRFKSDPNFKVLLISLKAGGVALNLTVASHVFIMDPWWNPAAEFQAIGRVHRFGQHKPIYATRFIVENTIEERILSLQEKKRLVFDSTIGGDTSSMGKLSAEDLRFLFQ